VILRPRDCGMVNSRPKIEIFRAGIRFSSAAVIANGCPSGRSKKPVYESRDRRFGSAPIAKTANMRADAADCEKPAARKSLGKKRNASLQRRKVFAIGCATC